MANTSPVPYIGVVRTSRTSLEDTPIQAALNRGEPGTIWIEPQYQEGLEGLEGFAYAWLLTWLDRPDARENPPPMRQTPFLLRGTNQKIGVFATRGPRRVNPIGLSLIQLLSIDGTRVDFAGVDVIDGTPVIDLKPYVQRFDRPPGEPACGWFDRVNIDDGITPTRLARPESLSPRFRRSPG
jgi:tRNA-Thr(GGU) m(6)t(6)A37 methyltransferase TsaA